MIISSFRNVSMKTLAPLLVLAGMLAAGSLHAGWGFAEPWEIIKNWGQLDQSAEWGLNLFNMSGNYEVYMLGVDDDCDGAVDAGFFLGTVEKAEELLSQLPTEEVAFMGGVLTKKGWSGVTFIDPTTFSDLILLSYGDPPAGLNITAPIVMDIREPMVMDKASPLLFKACGFLIAASQAWATRIEWDLDGDGVLDRVDYWGQNGPVFLGPVIPPLGKRDLLIMVTDDNVPVKTATFIVGGNLPAEDTLKPGDVVIPQSNMGFKLNLAAMDDTGAGTFSNMGFKLNYTLWQGGGYDPVGGTWSGPCDAWSMSSWLLTPEPSLPFASVRFGGMGLCTVIEAFDKRSDGCETNTMPPPMEEVSFSSSGSGKVALFYAETGWTSKYEWDFDYGIGGSGPAVLAVLDGEEWSIEITKKTAEEKLFASGGNGGGAGGAMADYYIKIDGSKYMGSYSAVNLDPGAEEAAWQWSRKDNTWMGIFAGVKDLEGLFIRGEVNFDSLDGPDISDAVFILQWLFTGGPNPICVDAADVNDDGGTDISDAVSLLGHLFLGTEPPKAPFPNAGIDPTPDQLTCKLME